MIQSIHSLGLGAGVSRSTRANKRATFAIPPAVCLGHPIRVRVRVRVPSPSHQPFALATRNMLELNRKLTESDALINLGVRFRLQLRVMLKAVLEDRRSRVIGGSGDIPDHEGIGHYADMVARDSLGSPDGTWQRVRVRARASVRSRLGLWAAQMASQGWGLPLRLGLLDI